MGVKVQICKTDAAHIARLLDRASAFYMEYNFSSRAANNARMCRRMASKLRKILTKIESNKL